MTREEIIQAIKEMTVLELNELVTACEEEFGVSAAAPVAVLVENLHDAIGHLVAVLVGGTAHKIRGPVGENQEVGVCAGAPHAALATAIHLNAMKDLPKHLGGDSACVVGTFVGGGDGCVVGAEPAANGHERAVAGVHAAAWLVGCEEAVGVSGCVDHAVEVVTERGGNKQTPCALKQKAKLIARAAIEAGADAKELAEDIVVDLVVADAGRGHTARTITRGVVATLAVGVVAGGAAGVAGATHVGNAHLARGQRDKPGSCNSLSHYLLPPSFDVPEWPRNCRVGANSPSLWPTEFSVMNTGTNFWPLWTAIVIPTMSGVMVDRRDHVRITRLSLAPIFFSTFSMR